MKSMKQSLYSVKNKGVSIWDQTNKQVRNLIVMFGSTVAILGVFWSAFKLLDLWEIVISNLQFKERRS